MDGCVPDSIRYVPGCKAGCNAAPEVPQTPQHREVGAPAATSVPNDCTREPCGGGVNAGLPPPTVFAIGQVTPCCAWAGLGVQVPPPVAQVAPTVPRPPPSWPTITSEVGTALAGGAVPPAGVGG